MDSVTINFSGLKFGVKCFGFWKLVAYEMPKSSIYELYKIIGLVKFPGLRNTTWKRIMWWFATPNFTSNLAHFKQIAYRLAKFDMKLCSKIPHCGLPLCDRLSGRNGLSTILLGRPRYCVQTHTWQRTNTYLILQTHTWFYKHIPDFNRATLTLRECMACPFQPLPDRQAHMTLIYIVLLFHWFQLAFLILWKCYEETAWTQSSGDQKFNLLGKVWKSDLEQPAISPWSLMSLVAVV